jgi:corticosteroid 11-beta-dehydrogenase isozyme 1
MGLVKYVVLCALIAIAVHYVISWSTAVDIKEYYKGKRIVLTGASRGIGRELAVQLAKLGSRLVIAARTYSKLEDTISLAGDDSIGELHPIAADISNERDCKKIIDMAVDKLGGIDMMILNAVYSPDPVWFMNMEQPGQLFLDTYNTNLLQSVYLINYGLPHLTLSKGRVIAVSSAASQLGMPKVVPYR